MASRNLGSLTVDLLLKMGGFKQGMDAAARETAAFEKKLSQSFQKVGGAIRGVAATFGIGIGIEALRRSALAAIEYGDEINKAASKTGVGVEQFSELAYAAKQTDIELAALGTAFKKMQVTMSEAASGTKSANETLAALGLSVEELRRLAPDKQFETLADRIAALKDPADRTRAAVELFGKAGADLLPLFEDGAAGIRALREEAQRMGATLTGEQAQALAEADDAIKRMGQSWDGLARTLTAKVAPSLQIVFDLLANGLALSERRTLSFAQAWEATVSAFRKGGIGTGPLDIAREMQALGRAGSSSTGLPPGGRNRKPFVPVVPGYLPEAPKSGRAAKSDVLAAAGLSEIAITAREITVGATEQLYRDMDAATRTATERALSQWLDMAAQLDELYSAGRISAEVFNARSDEIADQFLEPITITAEKIFPPKEQDKLGVFFEEASRGMQTVLADFLFNPFEDGIKGMLRSFGQMLQRMAAEAIAAQIAQKIFGAGVGTGGGWIGQLFSFGASLLSGSRMSGLSPISITAQRMPLPGLADGGFLRPGQLGIVGERGPEFAYGGRSGTTITPMGGTVNNYFSIQAPAGTVSRATEMQIAAAAARGAARASRRNN